MKYIVMNMNGDVYNDEFDNEEEAIKRAEYRWNHWTKAEKKHDDLIVLVSDNQDEDSEYHFDGNPIWKNGEVIGANKYVFADVTIEKAGGGCYMFFGTLVDGNWFFVTDCWDYSFITNKDLSEYLYDDCFYEKCSINAVKELDGEEHWEFRRQMLEYVVTHGHPEFVGYYD